MKGTRWVKKKSKAVAAQYAGFTSINSIGN